MTNATHKCRHPGCEAETGPAAPFCGSDHGLGPSKDGRDPRTQDLIAKLVGERGVVARAYLANDLRDHLDTLAQPAVDVDALKDNVQSILIEAGWDEDMRRTELAAKDIVGLLRRTAAQQPSAPGVVGALAELLEVAELRGDDQLPHPSDDHLMWSARMQTAWHEAQNALHRHRQFQEADAVPKA